jgi:hypothetical protein
MIPIIYWNTKIGLAKIYQQSQALLRLAGADIDHILLLTYLMEDQAYASLHRLQPGICEVR